MSEPGAATLSTSLLVRVRAKDDEGWRLLTGIYGPLVYAWSRRAGLQCTDAADVVQDVFLSVAANIHTFRGGRFRSWLWSIFHSRVNDFFRRAAHEAPGIGGSTANQWMSQLPDDAPPDESEDGARDLREVQHRALGALQCHIEPHLWTAFWRTAVEGDAPSDVAEDLGVSVWVVYKARSRVLQRLTRLLEGLDSGILSPTEAS